VIAIRLSPAGFTIIELLVSVAIVGVLAGVAVPVIQTTVTREKENQLRIALRDIRSAIDAFQNVAGNQNGSGNISATYSGQSGYPLKLTYLSGGVPNSNSQGSNAPGPAMYYFLRSIPRDPFYPDQTTPAINTWNLRSYEAPPFPALPDNLSQGPEIFDVSSSSTQVGLNGIPYNEW
jgi:general secretion pathway protein G